MISVLDPGQRLSFLIRPSKGQINCTELWQDPLNYPENTSSLSALKPAHTFTRASIKGTLRASAPQGSEDKNAYNRLHEPIEILKLKLRKYHRFSVP